MASKNNPNARDKKRERFYDASGKELFPVRVGRQMFWQSEDGTVRVKKWTKRA